MFKPGQRHRKRILWRQSRRCVWCHEPMSFNSGTIDHLIPKSSGGHAVIDNLMLACERCNGDKGHSPMARRAKIIRCIDDFCGDRWDAREARPTEHGWPIWFGWPHGFRRGRGGIGGPRVIITATLKKYLWVNRKKDVDLPIGRTTVRILRHTLGLDWQEERRDWWEAHADQLAEMTGADFARLYGLSQAIVSLNHKAMFGRRVRPVGWWEQEPAFSLLIGSLPHSYVAAELGISIGASGRLRSVLRRKQIN